MGHATLTCQPDGKWNYPRPTCKAKTTSSSSNSPSNSKIDTITINTSNSRRNYCNPNLCQHNAPCVNDYIRKTYKCLCSYKHFGKRCQKTKKKWRNEVDKKSTTTEKMVTRPVVTATPENSLMSTETVTAEIYKKQQELEEKRKQILANERNNRNDDVENKIQSPDQNNTSLYSYFSTTSPTGRLDPSQCQENAICRSKKGIRECWCNDGFRLNSFTKPYTCNDVDECSISRSKKICQYKCINTCGSYRCLCPPGYKQSKVNPRSCVDVNECAEGTDNCKADYHCQNTYGSYFLGDCRV